MTSSPLELDGDGISKLDDGQLEALVTRLCEAELAQHGLPLSSVVGGGNLREPDGGIDTLVNVPTSSPPLDFVQRPLCGFQVKAKRMAAGAVTGEMRKAGRLRPKIQQIMRDGGAYIIVSNREHGGQEAVDARVGAMRTAIGRTKPHAKARLDFYGTERLARWANQFPGVCLWVHEQLGTASFGWHPYRAWSSVPPVPFVPDVSLRITECSPAGDRALSDVEALGGIRARLAGFGGIAVRLVGLSGTGKTRFVQALFEEGIGATPLPRHLAVYCDVGRSPTPGPHEMLCRLLARGRDAILVVDNCNPATHRQLVDELRMRPEPRVALLSIEYDVADREQESTAFYRLAPMLDDVLDEILRHHYPKLSPGERVRISRMAEQNARIALALAQAATPPNGNLGTLTDQEIFERLFWQRHKYDPSLERLARVISLVYSFDIDAGKDDSEVERLARLADVKAATLRRYVNELEIRGLVQRRGQWRAILPHALANRLAAQELAVIDASDLERELWSAPRLRLSFGRRLRYLHHAPKAVSIAKEWLAVDGRIGQPQKLDEVGRELLTCASAVAPHDAMTALERALGCENGKMPINSGWVLEDLGILAMQLAYEQELFPRAARWLARACSSTYGLPDAIHGDVGRDSNVKRLETLFQVRGSGTHADVETRLAVLDEFWRADGRLHSIAHRCLHAALRTSELHAQRLPDFGAHLRDDGWRPQSWSEVDQWLTTVIEAASQWARNNPELTVPIAKTVAKAWRELWFRKDVQGSLRSFIGVLSDDIGMPIIWRAAAATLAAEMRRKDPRDCTSLNALEVEIRPVTIEARLRGLVLAARFDGTDPLGAEHFSSYIRPNAPRPYHDMLAQLGAEVAGALDSQPTWLDRLFDGEHYGYVRELGDAVGRCVVQLEESWDICLDAYERVHEPGSDFLVGIAVGVTARSPTEGQDLASRVAKRGNLAQLYGDIVAELGPQDDQVTELVALAERGDWRADDFSNRLRRRLGSVSPRAHAQLVRAVASIRDGGWDAALELQVARLNLPAEERGTVEVEDAVVCRELLLEMDPDKVQTDAKLFEVEILTAAAARGEGGADFARAMVDKLASKSTPYWYVHVDWHRILGVMLSYQPIPTLDRAFERLAGEAADHLDVIYARGDRPMRRVVPDTLVAWAAIDPERRAPWLAQQVDFVEPTPDGGEPKEPRLSDVARRLLDLPGDLTLTLAALELVILPLVWEDSFEAQTRDASKVLDELAKATENMQISHWAQDMLGQIERRVAEESHRRQLAERSSAESFERTAGAW